MILGGFCVTCYVCQFCALACGCCCSGLPSNLCKVELPTQIPRTRIGIPYRAHKSSANYSDGAAGGPRTLYIILDPRQILVKLRTTSERAIGDLRE
ncbi:hypothetical protein EVAR_42382_1 [Eumeta japonica]|uniref:Secreted protein n=1 Tax=Eumeta variegata TaxID=151549 RepID=A0A4C1YKH5_EUMVA|nr:hypothetical protein EVAR_42382_1 [Eumeta japonica]